MPRHSRNGSDNCPGETDDHERLMSDMPREVILVQLMIAFSPPNVALCPLYENVVVRSQHLTSAEASALTRTHAADALHGRTCEVFLLNCLDGAWSIKDLLLWRNGSNRSLRAEERGGDTFRLRSDPVYYS